ncbi:MAG TPA: RNA-binding S4 domain-containing protein [Rhodobacteraceae bacterium]|nr:RNA-binding S4 domain-containing protein [Paracoccaceae bacterium]
MPRDGQRIDHWLWCARMLKSRTLANRLVSAGKVRCNGNRIRKPGQKIAVNDVLTFALRGRVVILEVKALATRRGPYSEAAGLYEDLSPPPEARAPAPPDQPGAPARRDPGSGRPTKRERRAMQALRGM